MGQDLGFKPFELGFEAWVLFHLPSTDGEKVFQAEWGKVHNVLWEHEGAQLIALVAVTQRMHKELRLWGAKIS